MHVLVAKADASRQKDGKRGRTRSNKFPFLLPRELALMMHILAHQFCVSPFYCATFASCVHFHEELRDSLKDDLHRLGSEWNSTTSLSEKEKILWVHGLPHMEKELQKFGLTSNNIDENVLDQILGELKRTTIGYQPN